MSRKDDSPECGCSLRFRECEARRNRIFYNSKFKALCGNTQCLFAGGNSMGRITKWR